MQGYAADIEGMMQRFFSWLSEKDRRRDAAIEATKLGHGGVEYIARVLACDPKTIRQGLRSWRKQRMRRGAPPKKRGAARNACGTADPRSEPPSAVAGVHRWRSHARRRAVDELVAARALTTAVSAGHSRQSSHDPEGTTPTQTGLPHGAEEKDDGPPP